MENNILSPTVDLLDIAFASIEEDDIPENPTPCSCQSCNFG